MANMTRIILMNTFGLRHWASSRMQAAFADCMFNAVEWRDAVRADRIAYRAALFKIFLKLC